jgi:hypothetical protein
MATIFTFEIHYFIMCVGGLGRRVYRERLARLGGKQWDSYVSLKIKVAGLE